MKRYIHLLNTVLFLTLLNFNSFAQIDGSWSSLGAGLNGIPEKAVVFKDKLYVYGSFNASGGTKITDRIAVWDGLKWENFNQLNAGSANVDFFVLSDGIYFLLRRAPITNFVYQGIIAKYGLLKFDGSIWKEIELPEFKIVSSGSFSKSYFTDYKILLSSSSLSSKHFNPAITKDGLLMITQNNCDAPKLQLFKNDNFQIILDSLPNGFINKTDKCQKWGNIDTLSLLATSTGDKFYVNLPTLKLNLLNYSYQYSFRSFDTNNKVEVLENNNSTAYSSSNDSIFMVSKTAGNLVLPLSGFAYYSTSNYIYEALGNQSDRIQFDSTFGLFKNGKYVWCYGSFKNAGQKLANSIIVWDGQNWQNNTGGVTNNLGQHGKVNFIVEYKGEIIVGGDFGLVNNKAVNRIAKFTPSTATGIIFDQQNNMKLAVYPNPTENDLFIENKSGLNLEIEIFDLFGKQVKKENSNNAIIKINLSSLNPSTYNYTIKSLNDLKHGSIIKR